MLGTYSVPIFDTFFKLHKTWKVRHAVESKFLMNFNEVNSRGTVPKVLRMYITHCTCVQQLT